MGRLASTSPAEPSPPAPSVVRHDGPWAHRDISANGIRFHIAEAGAGPLVVLLHGFPQYWWSWRHQLPALAAAGLRVVAPDLRGYGDTDKPPRGYDAFTQAADVAGLIRALGEREAVLVGHGYGGAIAFNTAVLHPELIRSLVVVSGPHPMYTARIRRPIRTDRYGRMLTWAAIPWWPESRLTASGGALVERIIRSHAGTAWKATADFNDAMGRLRRAILIPGAAHSALEQLRWVTRSPFRADGRRHREALQRPVICPVLHVSGQADAFTPTATLARAEEYCANGYEMRVVPHVAHYPAEEAPAEVSTVIRQAAADADRRASG
jgi:pimeloyl-ACP methyl ester carboxylesterase